jgi:3-methyladenine DNA glycosylase AlkD
MRPFLADCIEGSLRELADAERAAGAQRYLKIEAEFLGVRAAPLRRVIAVCLAASGPLVRSSLLAAANTLWDREVFELRAAAVVLLEKHVAMLDAADLTAVERMLRESRTWALVDGLAPCVAGPMLDRLPELEPDIDRWARDGDFWIRRGALLVHLLPLRRGAGNFERFARYADGMLEEREFFIRKAIGWVLRETAKKRPELVADWLAPRAQRASGLTFREAVKHMPPELRARCEAARRMTE